MWATSGNPALSLSLSLSLCQRLERPRRPDRPSVPPGAPGPLRVRLAAGLRLPRVDPVLRPGAGHAGGADAVRRVRAEAGGEDQEGGGGGGEEEEGGGEGEVAVVIG